MVLLFVLRCVFIACMFPMAYNLCSENGLKQIKLMN